MEVTPRKISDGVTHYTQTLGDTEADVATQSASNIRFLKIIWCLIHNAHLRKIPSFCKIIDLKITHLKKFFD
jgi:hypothetical protein